MISKKETFLEELFFSKSDRTIWRKSDQKVIASLEIDTNQILWSRPSYAGHYRNRVKILLKRLNISPAKEVEQVAPSAEAQSDEIDRDLLSPPNDPLLGNYSIDHFLYDNTFLPRIDFYNKWGGNMTTSTLMLLRKRPELFTEKQAEEIKLKLSPLN